jgi:hypothetical protein
MPDKRERDLWWAFIAGRPESDWNPPKKPRQASKSKGKNKFGKMRGFAEDQDDQDDHATDSYALSQETWRINEEGEVELGYGENTTDTPIPLGTSLSADVSTDARRANVENVSGLVDNIQQVQMREPTPSLISRVDSVCEAMIPHIFLN